MSKSIIQLDKTRCYMCGSPYWLEEHHIFGGFANRKLSEKYGLKVMLCHYCHNEPPHGVHHNKENMLKLKQEGQKPLNCSIPKKILKAYSEKTICKGETMDNKIKALIIMLIALIALNIVWAFICRNGKREQAKEYNAELRKMRNLIERQNQIYTDCVFNLTGLTLDAFKQVTDILKGDTDVKGKNAK